MNKRTFSGILLLCCMLTACSTKEEKNTQEAVRVVTETVSEADANIFADTYVGEVEAQKTTSVSFCGNGTVVNIYVQDGQYVNKGQLIGELDATKSRNSLMAAEAGMKQAQDAYDRMKMLYENGSLSEMDWVNVQTTLSQAESNLNNMQKNLGDCRLVAPCSGVIDNKRAEAGATVMAGQPVCDILDISNVKVKINVPEKEITSIAKTATVMVDALGGEEFRSISMERGVKADAICRTYEIRYLVDNKDGKLLPGMVCNVGVEKQTSNPQNLITLPITSVQRGADKQMFVWTVKNGQAHRSTVSVGKSYGNRITITDGISKGDRVVVKGYQKLCEGASVIF